MKTILTFILLLAASGCGIATDGALLQANKYYAKGDYQMALVKISNAERHSNGKMPVHLARQAELLKAMSFEKQGYTDSAAGVYRYIIRNYPDTQEAYIAKEKIASIAKNTDYNEKPKNTKDAEIIKARVIPPEKGSVFK